MIEVIKHTLLITSFVLTMMLIIEYINIQTKGMWSKKLAKSRWSQLTLAVVLGLIPGCMGTYTVVSLYTHNVINIGALVAAMIATSGDEAFVMISLVPKTALLMIGILAVVAFVTGFIVNSIVKNNSKFLPEHNQFHIHEEEEECQCYEMDGFFHRLRHITFQRAVLLFGMFLVVFGLIIGDFSHSHGTAENTNLNLPHEIELDHDHHDHDHGHDHQLEEVEQSAAAADEHQHSKWDWMTITLLVAVLIALVITFTVPDHFLDKHLWEHIIKKHFWKIFLWTFGALLLIHYVIDYLDLSEWLESNMWMILLVAVLIGIIPESGPHLVFVTLFFYGSIPFSILLANSIVQDGHGALPLLAESKKSFFYVKVINLFVGFAVGGVGILLGF